MSEILRKRGFDHSDFEGKEEFSLLVRECFELARSKFKNFNLSDTEIPIIFFANGTKGGCVRTKKYDSSSRIYNLEFNSTAIKKDWFYMTTEAIPHEVAHIVTLELYSRKTKAHGHEWRLIAHILGCKGDRTHSIDLPRQVRKARKKAKKAIYIASCGTEVKIGLIRHKRMLKNPSQCYTLLSTRGKITAEGFTGRVA